MSPRKCRITAGVGSVLVGTVLLATTAGAQNPPTAQPRTTTGDRSATTPSDCQQMTGVDREECERTLSSSSQQTDPNTVNSTTRSVPSSSNPPSQDQKPDPASQTDQDPAHASPGKKQKQQDPDEDENATSESESQDEQEQPPPDTTSEANSDSDTDSDSQTPPQR